MDNTIKEFQGEYRWLSNFWPCPVELDGIVYSTIEHAYQAAKTTIASEREWINNSQTPTIAKRRSKHITIRPNWKNLRLSIMEDLCRQKFNQEPFRTKLLETGDCIIEEGNYWKDTFWGVYQGYGQNNLGKIIMKIRDELREKK